MVMFTRVFGLAARKMETVNIIITMEHYTKETLLMAKRVALESSLSPRRLKFRHIGIRPIYKGREKFFIAMVIIFMVTTTFPKSQDRECIFGRIPSTKGNSRRTVCREQLPSDTQKHNTMRVP